MPASTVLVLNSEKPPSSADPFPSAAIGRMYNVASWFGGATGHVVDVGYRLSGASGDVFSVLEFGNSGATHSSRSGSLSPGSYVFEAFLTESAYEYRGEGDNGN